MVNKVHSCALVALSLVLLSGAGCRFQSSDAQWDAAKSETTLAQHTEIFKQRVEKVADGLYIAIGFGLANSILIEGDDGVIIVDTMESMEAGEAVRAAFRKVTPKPVKAIVYTHNHADHIFGAEAFVDDSPPMVLAHATTEAYIDKIINIMRPIIFTRSMRQFGSLMPQDAVENCGIGPELLVDRDTKPGLLRPTETFDGDRKRFVISGVEIELVFAPGETPDQIFVWLPKYKALLPGDNFYRSFPNLYAIRGTSYRDVMDWARSIDKMRTYEPELLLPSHTNVLRGKDQIETALRNYRDAIQFVHDQTIRGINAGLTPDQLVERVVLPPVLAADENLQEFYGTVEWSVRSIFTGYLGWFSGDAADLSPLTGKTRSQAFAKLAGGASELAEAARSALNEGDAAWAVELARELSRLDGHEKEAADLLSKGFKALAETSRSANGRNYYLTQSMEWAGELEIGKQNVDAAPAQLIDSLPIEMFMSAMAVNLKPEYVSSVSKSMVVSFKDLNRSFLIELRHGLADIREVKVFDTPLQIETTSSSWKHLLAGRTSLPELLVRGELSIAGDRIDVAAFLLHFEPT